MHENVKKTGGSGGGACGPRWSCLVASTRMMVGSRTPRLYPERPRVGAAPSSVALTSGLLLYCKRTRRRGFVRVCRPEQRLKYKPPMFKPHFTNLSDMSDGGPVGRTAFKDESEMFSASNSTGPGFTCISVRQPMLERTSTMDFS